MPMPKRSRPVRVCRDRLEPPPNRRSESPRRVAIRDLATDEVLEVEGPDAREHVAAGTHELA